MRIQDEFVVGSKDEWGAMLAFASSDEGRPAICHILVSDNEVAATDGHRLLLWTPEKSVKRPRRRLVYRDELKLLLSRMAKGEEGAIPLNKSVNRGHLLNGKMVPSDAKVVDNGDDHTFPEYERVITGLGENPSAEPFGLNLRYVADMKRLLAFCERKDATGCRVVASGFDSPTAWEPSGVTSGHVLAIIMPTRL